MRELRPMVVVVVVVVAVAAEARAIVVPSVLHRLGAIPQYQHNVEDFVESSDCPTIPSNPSLQRVGVGAAPNVLSQSMAATQPVFDPTQTTSRPCQ